ncbi:hypothetical protein JXA84_07545 [candidate division WOR-3 bacterium]|nr:hypothetical protein [candidate division WOR-3 bacterium]
MKSSVSLRNVLIPSAALTVKRNILNEIFPNGKKPRVGDVVLCSVDKIGQHTQIENKSGRIHRLREGMQIIGVFGNRYSADYFEGTVPEESPQFAHILARSGVVGTVRQKSSKVVYPTSVRLLGYIKDLSGKFVNTIDYPIIKPKLKTKKIPRAKMILVCGSSMNSGKTTFAAACCQALAAKGKSVRASKITGTAGLKDVLFLNDSGAKYFSDFSFIGYPSTYLLCESDLLNIFDQLDLKHANNKDNYWVVEIADGILQRETSILLKSEKVRMRIHRLLFCASDPLGVLGGMEILKNTYALKPDLVSGVVSGSPLHVEEISRLTEIPILNSLSYEIDFLFNKIK